jgi:hypothetical protein
MTGYDSPHYVFPIPTMVVKIPPIAVGHSGPPPSPIPIPQTITALLLQLRVTQDDETTCKKQRYVHVSHDQFSALWHCFQQQQESIAAH